MKQYCFHFKFILFLILYSNSENHLPVSCGLSIILITVAVLILSETSHTIQTHHHLLYSQRMTLLPTSLWLSSPFHLNCFLHQNFLDLFTSLLFHKKIFLCSCKSNYSMHQPSLTSLFPSPLFLETSVILFCVFKLSHLG